ncbi:TetR/AcrR family transcriptional regulator C-terminal domain-containing protein [Kineococcus glutinatus]|uniref:TetR/AcrR family transcriptional regulator C-terminal domain-containing protein n=2 Tax=Kineococcus glutinatus TaxID=1070872 RepID=A0ABP9H577_9ACTN
MVAALAIVDADGVDALSIRRLAQALGRSPMALYHHAENKGDLLDGIIELLLEEVRIDAAAPDWRAELRRVGHGFRALALAHPHSVTLLVTRPLATPLGLRPLGTLRPLEAFLQLMTAAGMAGPDALGAYRWFFAVLHGHVLDEVQEFVADPEEHDDLLRLGLHHLPLRQFPVVRSLASEIGRYDGAAQLDRGLDVLLTSFAKAIGEGGAPPVAAAQG